MAAAEMMVAGKTWKCGWHRKTHRGGSALSDADFGGNILYVCVCVGDRMKESKETTVVRATCRASISGCVLQS